MTRLLAMAGYVYQSAAAIVLIFAISHLLPAADYTNFSLTLASSQLLCVLMFEWLQLAGLRFLAAARANEAARLRWSLLTAGLSSAAALLVVGSCASLVSLLPMGAIALGLGISVLQGLTDLYFLSIRLSDRLGLSSFLLALRATALLAGAAAGSVISGTAEAALIGIAAGQAFGLLAGLIAHRSPMKRGSLQDMLADWKDFSRYGMLAAGASVIHLSVPVLLRVVVIGQLGATGAGAGFSIALDLLQRPFWVLNAAIHTVSYPELIDDFEHGGSAKSVQSARRMFEFMICTTLVLLGGLIGFIPDAARILVPPASVDGFIETAPTVAAFYFLHTHLQATIAVVPHLEKLATRLVVVAAGQLALVVSFALVAMSAGLSPRGAVNCASLATLATILVALGPTLRFEAFPRWPLVVQAGLAAMLIGSLGWVPTGPAAWLAGKIVIAAIATAVVGWRGDFLMLARRA
ncbi:hypothetical protein JQ580_23525 [Bradyrhizobium japonicum]|uniref:hypothetical protein n=1 Tax=Bradyrhizobium japonicum TaxID=375 RepID=UPI001BADB4AA|nr:hypothetical protein [Bradyrhizobium japonicum]MBR0993699.1 hypothetical protein [Bradyrhizobium japonicum]